MRFEAGRALGWLRDTQSTQGIADLLTELTAKDDSLMFGHIIVALEMLGDPSVAGRLQGMVADAPERQLYWLTRGIATLTGHCPPLPDGGEQVDPARWVQEWRDDWARIDLAKPPMPRADWVVNGSCVEVAVSGGLGRLALTPDRYWESAWPEWDYFWCHDRQRVYKTGSICSTCEVLLVRIGWAPKEAVRLAQTVRDTLADVQRLDAPLLAALAPLLTALTSWHYQVRLVDLPVRAPPWAGTWYADDAPQPDQWDRTAGDLGLSPDNLLYQLPDLPFVIAPTIQKRNDEWSDDLLLDIDYIFKWVNPVPPNENYTFWIAPCTLVFKYVLDLKMSLDAEGGGLMPFEISDLVLVHKNENKNGAFAYEWLMDFQNFGDIRLKPYGFEQIVRVAPIHANMLVWIAVCAVVSLLV